MGMNVYKFILPGKLVSEYIGLFGKSWLRMRSTWQTNWVCAQVHERNFEIAITHIYIGQVPRIVYNPSCSEEFLALEFQKTFILRL